jgi:hypothetical protein
LRPTRALKLGKIEKAGSPTGFSHAGDEALVRHASKADSADAELAVHGPGAATKPAAHTNTDTIPGPKLFLARLVQFDLLQIAFVLDFFG